MAQSLGSEPKPPRRRISIVPVAVAGLGVTFFAVVVVPGLLPSTIDNGPFGRTGRARDMIGPGGPMTIAVEYYHFETHTWPTKLIDLIDAPKTLPTGSWRGPYLQENHSLRDPWDHEYQYEPPPPGATGPRPFKLWSMGPDGVNATADDIHGP